ncbi:Penicillopepsin-1 [Lipomyces doorenjongii]|uniref:Penicillopepsin-1 n=1 Tax=Lipomyces doorenjongii TaxID=383834 RepID=UPI0034CFB9EC
MLLDFDTGSSDFWVFSTELPKSQRGRHILYPLSGVYVPCETWSISYGDGSFAFGDVYADKIAIGPVIAPVLSFGAASNVHARITNDYMDGIVGLGFQSGATFKPKTVLTFMSKVGPTLSQNLFAANLRHSQPGEYDFGFIDKSKFIGALAYVSVDSSGGYWAFTISGYSIGGGSKIAHSLAGIADTGTTLLFIDNAILLNYWNKVKGAGYSSQYGGYIFPCKSALPDFSIYLNGQKRTMPGSYANFAPLNDGTGFCFGGIQSNDGIGFSVFGDVFLKSQYIVFDFNGPRLGWGQK